VKLLTVSPGCTTGPYFPVEFSGGSEDLTHRDGQTAGGQHIVLSGRVLELGGVPARNMVIEIWQPDSNGIFRHPLDPRCPQADPGFWSWGRARTNKDGWYRLRTVIPGRYGQRAPHINAAILGIGLTRRLVTTAFFSHDNDPVLACVPEELRSRLIPQRDASLNEEGAWGYRWDIILRGDGETPFFLD
jgi:protocatechuate 3,4-dioxygenase alpha subunit